MTQEIINIIEVVKATQRIPQPQRVNVTYYSKFDSWVFQYRGPNPCVLCITADRIGVFRGDQLRTWFPHHVIYDRNTIAGPAEAGRGLVHPHCYCELLRVLE